MPNISNELTPLDQAIDDDISKAILESYNFNDTEHQWFSLPARKGGLVIIIPSEVSDIHHVNSRCMTRDQVNKIVNQKQQQPFLEEDMQYPMNHVICAEKEQCDEAKTYRESHSNPKKIFEAITEEKDS